MTTGTARSDVLSGLAESAAADLADQIRRRGYGELPGIFSAEQLAEAREQAESAVAMAGGEYAGVGGCEGMRGAILRDLSHSVTLASLCGSLFTKVYGGASPDVRLRQTFRCLSGASGRRHSFYFHFDSYALTIIVPVAIPLTGKTGDLIFWPNVRRIRGSYLVNVVEKFIADRRPVQHVLWRAARRSRSLVRLNLVPGSIYIFCGYRALHANEEVDIDALRATMVLHCIDPHDDAPSKQLVGRVRTALAQLAKTFAGGRPSPTVPAQRVS